MNNPHRGASRFFVLVAIFLAIGFFPSSISSFSLDSCCVSGPVLGEEWYDYMWFNYTRDFIYPFYSKWFGSCHLERSTPGQVMDYLLYDRVAGYCAFAHGDSHMAFFDKGTVPAYNLSSVLYAGDIHEIMLHRDPVRISVVLHCHALADIGPGTWAWELTKGDFEHCIVIGINDSDGVNLHTIQCFLDGLDRGMTAGEAYVRALLEHPSVDEIFAPRLVGNASLTLSDLLSPVPLVFDVNGDGSVNVLDMVVVGQHWMLTGNPGWTPADVNRDGSVNVLDLILIGGHWTG